ncbi:DUF6382 domain-containing protein [Paenibacillus sp. HB172176]|uniref:DUF6382 domain-containing protein n=1 Tax=Paenibacillus sp. HB172176 TaxID=2493690 RepID=UPI00143AB983|nr:DUF6382 domain-containing protein [Paenibacillus sp. HB172176]
MEKLRIDFAMNRGHEMLIDRKPPIERHELDELELNMLRQRSIPYLLSWDWYELDGKVTFRYAINGSKLLLHRLQQDTLSMKHYYSLLLSLTDALMECKDYMLRPECCLLDDQYIFVGERLEDIRLAYIPLKTGIDSTSQANNSLMNLIVRWTAYVEPLDGSGLKQLLHAFNAGNLPLTRLRDILLKLISKTAGQAEQQAGIPEQQAGIVGAGSGSLREAQAELQTPIVSQSEHSLDAVRISGPARTEEDQEETPRYWGEPEEEEQQRPARSPWVAGALYVLLAALIWRFLYLSNPTNQRMLLSLALSLILLASLVYLWRRRSQLLMTSAEPVDEELFELHSGPLPSSSWPSVNSSSIEPNTTDSIGTYSVPPARMDDSMSNATRGRAMVPPTMLLGASETEGDEGDVKPVGMTYWLQRQWNGKEERIELKEDCFKIGRANEGVGYEEIAEGVSRLHLEIAIVEQHYQVKDLGSRNGSLLNGKLMIPYKSYPFGEGDQIHLAGDKGPMYELKCG